MLQLLFILKEEQIQKWTKLMLFKTTDVPNTYASLAKQTTTKYLGTHIASTVFSGQKPLLGSHESTSTFLVFSFCIEKNNGELMFYLFYGYKYILICSKIMVVQLSGNFLQQARDADAVIMI